ncbi:uncharacterized protein [Engystomops pustulosus]|uniref:uncharacterized protein n=1 Tax=Engystomops pustulosus TaxID=76066 RepID=UPI003AFABE36
MDVQERRRYIQQFKVQDNSLAENGYRRILLQLFGCTGHGKSTFINFCIYTLGDGEYELKAEASGSPSAVTSERRAYQLTDCITIVDNRGFGLSPEDVIGEICAQLGNFLPLNQRVERIRDFVEIMSKVEDSDLTPNYSDFIVPIYIQSVIETATCKEFLRLKTFFQNCRFMTGMYPIVVFTNKHRAPYSELESLFQMAGAEHIHAVENYTEDDNVKTRGRCNDLLAVIEDALRDAKFCMEQRRDPVRERIERKKFLLKCIYDKTIEKKIKDTKWECARLQNK